MGLLDFFSPEAGQRRRAWLDGQDRKAGALADYYLGPTGIPDKLRAVGGLLEFTDAGDMMAAGEASRSMWNNPSVKSAVDLAAAGAAMAMPLYSNRLGEGFASLVDEGMAAYDPSVINALNVRGQSKMPTDDVFSFAPSQPSRAARESALPPEQQQARGILDLLAQGRAGEVTDDMMAAADDSYLFRNYDLPMDEASRMQRAREMGFDTDAYHGTGASFSAFDPDLSDSRRMTGTPEGAAVFTDDPMNANSYANRRSTDFTETYADGGQVIPVKTRGLVTERANVQGEMTADKFFDFFEAERSSGPEWAGHINDLARETGADGYDRLFVDGVVDSADGYYTPQTTQFVFNPANIRSKFARFDPRLKHLANLSAGIGGVGLMTDAHEDRKRGILEYLEGL